jgi:hypothetical protein
MCPTLGDKYNPIEERPAKGRGAFKGKQDHVIQRIGADKQ